MTRRIFSLAVALLMIVALIPVGAVQASAASEYTCSDEFIEVVKLWEGFKEKPYWDVSNYRIGYGTTVPKDKLDEWKETGITQEYATELLREHLKANETRVNEFIDKHGIQANQGIFDALVSVSFNCGSSWLYNESTLRTAVIEGWTGNDLLFAFGQWSTAAGSTRTSLINRRMSECNMYLNGLYGRYGPEHYSYVRFDANGGKTEIITQCFDTNTTAAIRAVPTYEGYNFEGWYTDRTGGEKVTQLDSSVKEYMLYAHWSAKEGTQVPEDTITGTAVDFTCTVSTGQLSAFRSPVSGASVVASYAENEKLAITAEYTDASGVRWGKTKDGGWINLAYTSAAESENTMNVQITVTGTGVNIRKGPGTSYGRVKMVNKGYKMTITQVATGGGYTWGKSSEGWIALKYTNYDSVSGGNSGSTDSDNTGSGTTDKEEDKVIATGKVAVETKLNVRKGPGTGYAVATRLSNGTSVEIYETKQVGSITWGRMEKGWISLEYVQLDKQEEDSDDTGSDNTGSDNTGSDDTGSDNTGSDNTGSDNTGSDNTGSDNTGSDDTGSDNTGSDDTGSDNTGSDNTGSDDTGSDNTGSDDTGSDNTGSDDTGSDNTDSEKTVTGTVEVDSWLNVRSGAGTNYPVVATLKNGVKVEISEQTTVKGTVWGKTEKGWVSMDYIVLDKTEETASVTGTISCGTAQLRIRTAPNAETVAGYLVTGDKVTILEQKTVDGVKWGRVEKGWIMMKYVILDKTDAGDTDSGNTDSGNTDSGNTSTTVEGTITGDYLRIRSGPGTSYTVLGFLHTGDKVTILETKTVNGVKWGRTAKGWISMDYVKV